MSCGEILGNFGELFGNYGRFCHNLRAFMWRKIEPKKYICGEKMTIMRSDVMLIRKKWKEHSGAINYFKAQ